MINGIFVGPPASSPTPLPIGHASFDMTPGLQMTNSEACMDLLGGAECERDLGRAGLEGDKKGLRIRNFTELA